MKLENVLRIVENVKEIRREEYDIYKILFKKYKSVKVINKGNHMFIKVNNKLPHLINYSD